MKKRLLLTACILLLCAALCACGGQSDTPQQKNELQPVGTAAPVPEGTAAPSAEVSAPVTGGDEPVSNDGGTDVPQPTAPGGNVTETPAPSETPIIPFKPQVSSSGNLVVN